MNRYAGHGLNFEYPSSWTLDEDESNDVHTITIQSPGTAFLLLSLRPDADDPAQVADETLDALKVEYPELDAVNATETIAGRMALGYDVDFVALDAVVIGRIRSLDTDDSPLLILTQCGEMDRPKHEPALKAMVRSLVITEEEIDS